MSIAKISFRYKNIIHVGEIDINQQVYSNGLGRMFIPDSIAFLRFTM